MKAKKSVTTPAKATPKRKKSAKKATKKTAVPKVKKAAKKSLDELFPVSAKTLMQQRDELRKANATLRKVNATLRKKIAKNLAPKVKKGLSGVKNTASKRDAKGRFVAAKKTTKK
ncbi:hypothetical protein FACS189464_1840 [Bacteroidia bacterium]|nr:hypothetical protein FACS189464_1840 [Bacteroidia bacterium]